MSLTMLAGTYVTAIAGACLFVGAQEDHRTEVGWGVTRGRERARSGWLASRKAIETAPRTIRDASTTSTAHAFIVTSDRATLKPSRRYAIGRAHTTR